MNETIIVNTDTGVIYSDLCLKTREYPTLDRELAYKWMCENGI